MRPNHGPREEHSIAHRFISAINANFVAEVLCGFVSVKRKRFRLPSHFHMQLGRDFHSSGVKSPKTFALVSKTSVSVFACPSHRPRKSLAPKASRLPRHTSTGLVEERRKGRRDRRVEQWTQRLRPSEKPVISGF
jgi:hypothetical protein